MKNKCFIKRKVFWKKLAKFINDFIIFSSILCLIAFFFYLVFVEDKTSDSVAKIISFVGALVFILFGITGLFDFAYITGLHFLYPSIYKKHKKKKSEQDLLEAVNTFLLKEAEAQPHLKARLAKTMHELGFSQEYLQEIRLEILKINLEQNAGTLDKAKECMQSILCEFKDEAIKKTDHNAVYKEVKFYTDIRFLSYDNFVLHKMADCLEKLIHSRIRNLDDFDHIIIPYDSNQLLGQEIAKRLGKSLIQAKQNNYIFMDQYYESFNEKLGNRCIIIHDVLVTGTQVKDSIAKIKIKQRNIDVDKIFCIINRVDNNLIERRKQNLGGLKIFSLLDLDDDILESDYFNRTI